MREEVISSGTLDPTPAASSAGASSPAGPTNVGSVDGSIHGRDSKAASISCVGSQPPQTSLSTSAGGSAFGMSRQSCRPWERGDLLRRLATFKPGNWFGKPKVANSLACAQRGWMNIDVDKIECESCGACLNFALLPLWTLTEAQNAGEEFAKQLDSGHRVSCPWRGNSCPESMVQFPPTPHSALVGVYKDRCDGLLQFQFLPTIAASSIEQMRLSRGPEIDRLLSPSESFTIGEVDIKPENTPDGSQDRPLCLYSSAQKLISLCGWEPRWLLNVQDCEEHSAQSARNGGSFGPTQPRFHFSHDEAPSKKALSTTKRDTGKRKLSDKDPRSEFRSPWLDCNICGATVRVSDFITISRPARFAPNDIDIPDTSKKMGLTRGVSAASGINGWVAADDTEKEQTVDRDEVATTNDGKHVRNADVDLNLTMAGSLSFPQFGRTATSGNLRDGDMGRDLIIGQPSGSEVGDRAASYESRGPSSKRSLEIGGSSDDRLHVRMQQADSVEGTVTDRDCDEVTDGRQYSAGPSKRTRDSDIFDTHCSYPRDSAGAGPSHSMGLDLFDGNIFSSFQQGSDRAYGMQSARDSTRASSVIAMDTVHGADDDSMESVENYPGDVDDVHFPSSSTYGNLDINEASELNYSNQAQQSIYLQRTGNVAPGEMGVSSTNDGEEIFNAETVTAQARDGFSFGISGGSVGMCASHEAEIHGADASVHRAHSVVGDMEPRVEDAENQGQTGESIPDPGMMDEIVPNDINREDPHGDSQEMISQPVERADSGSKIDGTAKADSIESGEKISESRKIVQENSGRNKKQSVREKIRKDNKNAGPPKGESNYEEATEFDPIVHHNQFCPWVNGNVAAAGSTGYASSSSSEAVALSGWQLTLDAIRSLEHVAVQTLQSESAASMYKDEHQAPGEKLLRHHSMSKSHGQP